MNISIIGSLCGSSPVDKQAIEGLLNSEKVALKYNGDFTGKPDTSIYINEQWVLKISRSNGFPSLSVAEKWCSLQIEKEKGYGVYHSQRTWLVFAMNEQWMVANITPRMQALHTVDFHSLDINERTRRLLEVLKIYMNFTSEFGLRLDEGLSNFGILDGHVCYLDDDIYPWDNFSSLSAMLGNWVRKSDVLAMDADTWKKLGELLQPLLRAHSSDAEDMVREGIIDQIVGQQETLKMEFLTALRPVYKFTMTQQAKGEFLTSEPIALIADVHANLPAFEAILKELDSHGVRQYLMLGDIVGYGPNPNECIQLIRQRNMFCIRGNHDHYVAHNGDVRVAMGKMAKWTADWTLGQLHDDEKMWLGALPVRHQMNGWMAIHGSPVDKSFFNGYVYNMTSERNLDHLKKIGVSLCLHGHSHIQGVYALQAGQYLAFDKTKGDINLRGFEAALVCPGSVGQPRGGEVEVIAEVAIFYPEENKVKMLSTPYDITRVIADMEKQKFPEQLIKRLREGR